MDTPLDELFAAHHRDVYGYLYGLCRDARRSEELTCAGLLEAVRSTAGFRGAPDCTPCAVKPEGLCQPTRAKAPITTP